jgi:mRNA interferase RelE/StbE
VTYRVEFAKSVHKELASLPKNFQIRVIGGIEGLQENPRPHGIKKLKNNEDLYRIRIGDYRVVFYIFDSSKKILVTRVQHRREVYR